jgi:uncharacterized protein YlxW (UPF0749 family)
MTLITTMMRRPLDPGYAAAAERRTAAGLPPSTSLRSPLLLAATLVIGLVVGVAAYNLTATTSPRSAARADLIGQIEHRRADVDRLAAEAASLQAQVSALESTELGGQGTTVARTRELARSVGTVAMHGPGIQVTLDDAPGADAGDQASGTQADQGRVYARDLQFVVNSLWEAGAEAVSINGKRLTSLSAIRFAGSAIIVGYRPLARPYVVTAIGNPRELPAAFADGPGGSYVSTLRSTFGVRADTSVVDDVTVPAAVGLTTRYAKTRDTGATATPTATTTPGATSTTEDAP